MENNLSSFCGYKIKFSVLTGKYAKFYQISRHIQEFLQCEISSFIARMYPSKPLPAIVFRATGETYEMRRKASRELISEICTSTVGMPTALSASGMAMLVCVYAAGFMTMPSVFP